LPYRRPKCDDRYECLGKWQDDGEEKPKVAAAVHLSRVPQLFGNAALEKRAGHDDVEDGHRERQHDDPKCIVEVELPRDQKRGDEAAAEEHDDEEHRHKKLAKHQIAARERIRSGQVDRKAYERTHQRVEDGDVVAGPDSGGIQQCAVAIESKAHGVKPHFAGRHRRRFAEGGNDDEVQRVQYGNEHQHRKRVNNDVEYAVRACNFYLVVSHVRSSLPQAVLGQPLGNLIDCYEKDQVDHRVKQVDGCGIAVLVADDAYLVYIGGDDFAVDQVQVVLHEVHLLKAYVHEAACVHNEQNDRCGQQHGDVDVAYLQPAGRTVHRGSLVKRGIHAGQCGQVYDAVPPHVLPNI
jgi:hypothetical protein